MNNWEERNRENFGNRKSDESCSAQASPRVLLVLLALFLIPLLLGAAAPQWWTDLQVIDPGATANDYAAINQGQLKNLAVKAYAHLRAQTNLPPNTWSNAPGTNLTALITSFQSNTNSTSNYNAVNLGQLKNVAKPFYDMLNSVGYTNSAIAPYNLYPWVTAGAGAANDYAMANIGQAKNLFSFDLTNFNQPDYTIPPVSPNHLTATMGSAGNVTLNWSDNSNNETGFQIQRSLDGGKTWTTITSTAANTTSYMDSAVPSGKFAIYQVTAINQIGQSTPSPTVSQNNTDPETNDADHDGRTDAVEAEIGTDPNNPDTDGDGLMDGAEAVPLNAQMKVLAAPESNYAIIDLGLTNVVGYPLGINDSGQVLMREDVILSLWSNGTKTIISQECYGFVGLLQDSSVYYLEWPSTGGEVLKRWNNGTSVEIEKRYDASDLWWNENLTDPFNSLVGAVGTTLESPLRNGMETALGNVDWKSFSDFPVNPSWGVMRVDSRADINRVNDLHRQSIDAGYSVYGGWSDEEITWSISCDSWMCGSRGDEDDGEACMSGYSWSYYWNVSMDPIFQTGGDHGSYGDDRGSALALSSDGYYLYKQYTLPSDTYGISKGNARTILSDCENLRDINNKITNEGPYILGKKTGGAPAIWCYNSGSPISIVLDDSGSIFRLDTGWGWVVGRTISNRLEIPLFGYSTETTPIGCGYLWRNSRLRSLQELCGNPTDWSGINATQVSPNNGLLMATASYSSTNSALPKERHSILLIPAELAVDANRDGTIVMTAESSASQNQGLMVDATIKDKPFTFWVNNDRDGYSTDVGETTVQDDLDPSSGSPDSSKTAIACTRDLEDYARLWLYIGGLIDAVRSDNIQIGFKWREVTGNPSIRIFKGADFADGGSTYLTDNATANSQTTLPTFKTALTNRTTQQPNLIQATPTSSDIPDFIFDDTFFFDLSETNPKKFLIFDGVGIGKGRLALVFVKDGKIIGEANGVWLDLKDMKSLYERWTVGDGPAANSNGDGGGGAPAAIAVISQARLPSGVTACQYTASNSGLSLPDDPNGNKYILFVHGWNVFPWEKDARAETMLKRLYWQGYKGKFGAYDWPTTYHTSDFSAIQDFDEGEYSGWRSAVPLKTLFATLHGKYPDGVYAMAHSGGNIVTGEALRLAAQSGAGTLVDTYVASQAAVPVHCYDPSQPTPTDYFNSWRTVTKIKDTVPVSVYPHGPDTPNIYNNWMTPNSGSVSSRGNFYNVNDYALSRIIYETDQALKPDIRDQVYYYASSDVTIVADLFKKSNYPDLPTAEGIILSHTGIFPTQLHLGSASNVQDRYEIMAYDSEPRCRALGATSNAAGFAPTNLQSLWPADTYGNHDYGSHPWHSAQFRFTNMDQKGYWTALMDEFNLPTNP